jgi:hypothetical protein
MSDDKVRVYARGASLVPDFDAADREPPIRRMIGRKYEQVNPGQWGWTPSGEPQAVSKRAEVARALADGDLAPADAETAAWATSITRVPVKFELPLESGTAGEEQ